MASNGTMPTESIIRKIQALMNVAGRTEEEAASFMAKAQELMAAYNVDVTILGQNTPSSSTESLGGPREKQRTARTAQYDWQQQLMKAIAEANFCWHWITEVYETDRVMRGGKVKKFDRPHKMRRHVILGKEANRAIVEMMYNYLIDTIEAILPFENRDRLSNDAHIWRRGCTDRLCERIKEKAESLKTQSDSVASAAPVGSAGCAITLRSVAEKEYQANYDARYGEGAWARSKANEAKWASQEYQQEQQRRYELREAEQRAKLLAETPAQRAKREAKEAREAERREQRWAREDEKEASKRSGRAYWQGRDRAESINLDSQLKEGKGSAKGELK